MDQLQVIVGNPVDILCNCYSSHVLRRLMCLFKGVSLDFSEFHGTKSSSILAGRLNLGASRANMNDMQIHRKEFPHLPKSLVSRMLKCSRTDIKTLLADQYRDEELLKIIPILLGCKENIKERNFIQMNQVQVVLSLVKETTYNHLMEVIIEVSSESLYNELFHKIFRNLLYDIASHKCGSFVAQALVSNTRSQEQMDVIREELGTKFRDLFIMGRSGVVASLLSASHKLSTHEHKCCQALIAALHSENESQTCIFPEYYFLTATFAVTTPLNVNGPLEFIQPLITSITSMEMDQVLEATQDAAGTRVIEVFLDPNASWKQKCKLIVKLQGHFGDISMHSSGSFIVEKCFTASNLSMKEVIVSELSYVRNELSKTKHGPHLIRKLNVNGKPQAVEEKTRI
ncbi:hypothetical protein SAY87_029113 [Trapa incisa]|uniref:PUM-HD domain-containing protein n=1 Tax=Trapa incisa TaxID=236973 RepID=A0AAN7QPF2_9MYRT|nr:hypothetical protein SAY87_029113 [Trapa incisa]